MPEDRDDLITGSMATLLHATRLPSFLGAPWIHCDTAEIRSHDAKAAILGVPFDQATVYRSGSSHGPRGLRQASEQYLPYLGEFDINLFEEFHLVARLLLPLDEVDHPVHVGVGDERHLRALLDALLDGGQELLEPAPSTCENPEKS